LDDPTAKLPDGVYLSNFNSYVVSKAAEAEWEPTVFVLQPAQRRIDIKWQPIGEAKRWLRVRDVLQKTDASNSGRLQRALNALDSMSIESRARSSFYDSRNLWLPLSDVKTSGAEEYAGLGFAGRVFLCPGTKLTSFLIEKSQFLDEEDSAIEFLISCAVVVSAISMESRQEVEARLIAALKKCAYDLSLELQQLSDQLLKAISNEPYQFFDANAWSYREKL
jgi:hypothetical protein